jgi:hypothetical protein
MNLLVGIQNPRVTLKYASWRAAEPHVTYRCVRLPPATSAVRIPLDAFDALRTRTSTGRAGPALHLRDLLKPSAGGSKRRECKDR